MTWQQQVCSLCLSAALLHGFVTSMKSLWVSAYTPMHSYPTSYMSLWEISRQWSSLLCSAIRTCQCHGGWLWLAPNLGEDLPQAVVTCISATVSCWLRVLRRLLPREVSGEQKTKSPFPLKLLILEVWTVSAREVPEVKGNCSLLGHFPFLDPPAFPNWLDLSAVARRTQLPDSRVILDHRGYPWPIALSMVLFWSFWSSNVKRKDLWGLMSWRAAYSGYLAAFHLLLFPTHNLIADKICHPSLLHSDVALRAFSKWLPYDPAISLLGKTIIWTIP